MPPKPLATHGSRSIAAVRTESPLILDGILDEPAWQEANGSQEFIQKDPREGEPSTERTGFRVRLHPYDAVHRNPLL